MSVEDKLISAILHHCEIFDVPESIAEQATIGIEDYKELKQEILQILKDEELIKIETRHD